MEEETQRETDHDALTGPSADRGTTRKRRIYCDANKEVITNTWREDSEKQVQQELATRGKSLRKAGTDDTRKTNTSLIHKTSV